MFKNSLYYTLIMKDVLRLKILTGFFLAIFAWLWPKTGNLLIVKLDGIGDYVLFRNFIQKIRESEKYKDCRITLCANIKVKDLALSLDMDWIDDFVWIDKERFMKSFVYKMRISLLLRFSRFETVIHPTYSRDILSDLIVRVTDAKIRIGDKGDLSNIKIPQKEITDQYYTLLVDTGEEVTFEFLRTKKFMEKLLTVFIDLKKPEIILPKNEASKADQSRNLAVLFPSASNIKRRWSTEHFAKLAEYIASQYGYEIAVCGARSDKPLADELLALLPHLHISDCTGSSLSELASILAQAKIVIANDTSAMHMACAVNTNVVCISGGRHFGRYTPYPHSVYEQCLTVYPKAVSINSENLKELKEKYRYRSDLDINSIENVDVESRVDLLLR